METPFIRAKAKDNAEALDNLLSSFEDIDRLQILDYVTSTFKDIEAVLVHAMENGGYPLAAYKAFMGNVSVHLTTEE